MKCVEQFEGLILFSSSNIFNRAAVEGNANAKVRRPAHHEGLYTLLACSLQDNISLKTQNELIKQADDVN